MKWQLIKSTEKYRNKYMYVTEDELVTDHGEQVTFGIVHKEPAAIVIPWDGQKFTMIKQYRYGVDFDSWEFPAGHYEHDTVENTARAELEEEAGLLAGSIKEIGTYHIAPGHNTQICHVFLAEGLSSGERKLERSEKGMQIGIFSLGEINQMIISGEIKDGLTIVALKFFELMKG